jgi:hypothetical protein
MSVSALLVRFRFVGWEVQMFAQIIRGRVSDPAAVRRVVDRWMTELGPTATGWLGSTGGVTDDKELFVLVRFESEQAARANSDRPEQGAWWAEMEPMLDGDATFQDSNEVYEDIRGDLDSAGFVQVMTGQTSDPERTKELMTDSRDDREAFRPEILGQVAIAHAEGEFTFVNYFTTEAAAREGERKPRPPELEKLMTALNELRVGEPEFLDLRSPWLDSPA